MGVRDHGWINAGQRPQRRATGIPSPVRHCEDAPGLESHIDTAISRLHTAEGTRAKNALDFLRELWSSRALTASGADAKTKACYTYLLRRLGPASRLVRARRKIDLLGKGRNWPVPGHYIDAEPHRDSGAPHLPSAGRGCK